MKRFVFRLEAVRSIRRREEEMVERDLALAIGRCVEAEALLAAHQEKEQQLYSYMRSGLAASVLAHVAEYTEQHRRKNMDFRSRLVLAESNVTRHRGRLAEASAKREALDRLRDKQRDAHRREFMAEEARELDEVASMRFARAAIARGRAA